MRFILTDHKQYSVFNDIEEIFEQDFQFNHTIFRTFSIPCSYKEIISAENKNEIKKKITDYFAEYLI